VASDKTLPVFGSCHLSRVTRHARSQQDNRKTIEEKKIQAARHPAMAQFESAWAELSPARFRAKSGGTACTPSP
jgi:hypothetical protein